MHIRDLKPEQLRLPAGLRLQVVPMPHLHRSVLEVHVRTGSRFEEAADNGLSHFLEHMLYRGTPRYPSARAQAHAFESLGGTLMAATAKDFGSLQLELPASTFADSISLVGEVYQHPLLRDGIETERGIVREEILETLDENGTVVDPDEVLSKLIFGEHALAYPITGSVEQVDHFDSARLHRHHRRTHVGSGTTVTAAGPLDPDRTLQLLESAFGSLPAGAVQALCPAPPQEEARFRLVKQAGAQTSLRVAFRGPSFRDPTEPETQILLRLLDDGMSTRLYTRLCDEMGLCYDVSACFEAYEDVGLVHLSADCANENAARVLRELLTVVARLRDVGPSEAELEKAKVRHGWQLEELLDDPAAVASHFGLNALLGQEESLSRRRQCLAQVDRARVLASARRVFTSSQLSVAAVGSPSAAEAAALERATRDFR